MANKIRILLIEDSEVDELLLMREIRRGGFEPIYVRVMTEADLLIEIEKGPWDMVISDYNLAGFNGLEVLKIVKERLPDVPFILVSGTVGEDVAVQAMKSGAQNYIMKDNMVRLGSAISRELSDIAARRESLRLLAVKEEELRQAQKMEAIGQIAGGLAHDFNNILGIIGLYAESIEASPNTDHVKDSVSGIMDAHRRGAKLVQQLLTVSRKDAIEVKVFELNMVVKNLLEIMGVALGREHEIVLKLTSESTAIMCDQNQIEQVLMNLVINARDAITDSGEVIIRTQVENQGERSHVVMMVSDNGCGMDEQTLKRSFEPFFTTKEVGKGTGLGLATVHAIVKQHGGEIDVISKVGEGTTFKIRLPGVK